MRAIAAPTILVVEDEPPIRELLAELLRDEGYTVLEAHNGQEAIHVVDQHLAPGDCPSLILLDMMLPRVDGAAVLEHLNRCGCGMPVIAMSASRAHLAAARAIGANAVLTKPFDLDQLLRVVAEHCPPAR